MKNKVSKLYLTLVFLFLYAPIAVLVVYSFNNSKSRGSWGGFTFKWYLELFKDRDIKTALYYTVTIAVTAAVVSTILGTISAIGIYNMKSNRIILFLSVNIKLGFSTMLLAHITFDIPYVILSVLPKLKQLDKNITEAALDLGATPFYSLRKIIIPQIKPGIITGFLIAFTLSIDDFVISFFTTGSGVTNLSIEIYSMARRGISPTINALSSLMLAVVLGLLLIINKRTTLQVKE